MFFKVVLIGTVLDNVPDTFVSWGMWLAVIGALHILCELAGERFKNIITYSPNAIWIVHFKAISLFLLILVADLSWFYVCLVEFKALSIAQKLLLIYECITLFLDSLQGIFKYSLYLIDNMKQGWEDRGLYSYYIEFFVQSIKLTTSIGYFLTILTLNGIHFGVFELVIVLNLRTIIMHLKSKIAAYKNYRKLTAEMDTIYPNVTTEELSQIDDNCAICRDPLTSAKKLPCGHLFHTNCLRSWLEYNSSCPSCRFELIRPRIQLEERPEIVPDDIAPVHNPPNPSNGRLNIPNLNNNEEPRNHSSVWQINLPRWLPSFSVEVVNDSHNSSNIQDERIRQHVAFIKETFPDYPDDVILRDLLETGNYEQTINNILEGRLTIQNKSTHTPVSPQPRTQPRSTQDSVISNHEMLPTFRDSFKSSPDERQMSFQKRKMMMMEVAKKKFRNELIDGELRKKSNDNDVNEEDLIVETKRRNK